MDDAVDLGRLAMRAADARCVDEHRHGRADQRVATVCGDVVLQLAQFGESLVHQLRIDGAVEVGGVGAVLAAVGEEPAPVELRLLDEVEQLVVVGLGLARDSRR